MWKLSSHCLSAVSAVFFLLTNSPAQQTAPGVDSFMQVAKLTASSDQQGEMVGVSVAVDGDTLVAGCPFTVNANGAGEALVFVKPASGWKNLTQTAFLIPSDGASGNYFGAAVAIRGDTIVVGSVQNQFIPNGPGAVYVYVKPAGGWQGQLTETAKLVASDGGMGDALGSSVSITGNTIVAGAPSTYPFSNAGAAYVFVKPTGGWKNSTETAKLKASDDAIGDEFGYSVSLDGNTLVAGAPYNQGQGATYVFVEPSGGWKNMTQTAKLTASDGIKDDAFGYSVSIDGNTVASGAPYGSISSNQQEGSVYIFVEPAGGWKNMTQTAKLTEGDGQKGDLLGSSVAINGGTVAAGAAQYSRGPSLLQGSGPAFWREGAVYLFSQPAGGWKTGTSKTKLNGSDARFGAYLGSSVALNGKLIVTGAPILSYLASYQGAAYLFEQP